MRARLLERMVAGENTLASYVFLLTASAVLALYGSPANIGVAGTLFAIAGTSAAYVLFLEVYCRLAALDTNSMAVRPAHLLVVALPVAVSVVLLLAKSDTWFGSGAVWAKTFETAVGDYEMLVLSDASIIELNADTRISTRYSRRFRQIVLERGEAHFSVVYDATRPLNVHSEAVTATALGTEFSVRRHDATAAAVMVERGRVRVTALTGTSTVLKPGDAAFIKGSNIVTRQLSAAELACKSSWRERRARTQPCVL